MKEKRYYMISYVVIALTLIISLYNLFYSQKESFGNIYGIYYGPLEYNLSLIKDNMNEITISNDNQDWLALKKINTSDEKLRSTYNLLVDDIKTCYLQATDLKNRTYKTLKILSFKDKKGISDNEISQLRKNENCLKNFDKYKSSTLSTDPELSNRIKNQIGIITKYEESSSKGEIFIDLLYEEMIKINQIANLTNWLKIEYNSHK